jgi:ATP-dependent exoDNAse (exonuclease V) beta subunit
MTAVPAIDADARRAIVGSLDETLLVEAAAGTGKTTALIDRILAVLSGGRARMTEVVAVTFTEKAAGELKLRLREALEKKRTEAPDDEVRRRLEDALETLEEAHVNTIHGFCAELLRERPVEARVDPLFVVLTEPQADRLYDRAFDAWLQEALQDPPEGVRRALRRTAFGGAGDGDGPVDRLRGAGRQLVEAREFPHPWRHPRFDRAARLDALVERVHRFADLTSAPLSGRDGLYVDTDGVRRLSAQIRLEQSFGQRDLDGWEARLVDLSRDRPFSRARKGSGHKFGKTVGRSEVLAERDGLLAEVQEFRKDADADLAARLQQELAGATGRYEALKRAAGALDFADLLVKTRDLVRDNDALRAHLQQKFARVFVDEFQDTDPVQAEILLLLAGGVPGKLFLVGDPKQAIYRFRGTDVGTYWRVKERVERQGGRVVQLTTSYRSVPTLQRFVNAAFEREMTGDERSLQAAYEPLAPYRPEHPAQPAIVALPVPRPYGRGALVKVSGKAIDDSLPDAVGAFIAWLVDERSGWTVAERQADGNERRVPVQPRHVAVLFRRFVSFRDDVTRPYVEAIEARGIPHLLVGGKAFHGRDEVEAVRAALAAIEWPDDELSVFATLKGPLCAIDDEQLLEFSDRFGVFHPFRVPNELGGNTGRELALAGAPTAHLMPIADALRLLQQLHRNRNYRPVADTIGRLLTETRAHVGFVLRPAGEQALANVLHVAELARQYEAGGGISFRGFIDELRRAADSSAVAEAPILEEGSEGVRLMTVHKAKGLEFPVVILADLTCRLAREEASRYLDAARGLCAMRIGGWAPWDLYEHEQEEVARDRAEAVRLAYVAATRARDLLVVPAVGDGPWEGGWFGPLNAALYPPVRLRRSSVRGRGCPVFKSKDSVLERPGGEAASVSTVCPGEHAFEDAGYSIVWWDPAALVLDVTPSSGVRREDLIMKDVPRHVIERGRARYDAWRLARQRAREAGEVPSARIRTVREWAQQAAPVADAGATREAEAGADWPLHDLPVRPETVRIVELAGAAPGHPSGTTFGLLVHAVLAQAPLEASRAELEDLAAVGARVLGLGDDAAASAVRTAEAVLSHDVLAPARRAETAGRCRRETPVSIVLTDGTLIEGVVDLAFEDDGAWTVVDYKTDREIAAAGTERYRRQVALYASAIARATGAPASGILMRV